VAGTPTEAVSTGVKAPSSTGSIPGAALTKFKADTAKAMGAASWADVNPRVQQQVLIQAFDKGGEFEGATAPPEVRQAAQQQVRDVIDAAIPPSGKARMLNLHTKAKAEFYIQRGNVDAAKQAIQKGANSVAPSTGTALEDKAFQELSRDDLARAGQTSWREKNAIRQAAENPGTGKTEQAARLKAADAARVAYEQTMQQEMPAFSRQGSPQSLAVELPPDEDLTAILQRSVALAKKSKTAPTRPDTAPWGGAFLKPAGGGRQ
jgi:hypothetical protein